jgi:hypothetical protein
MGHNAIARGGALTSRDREVLVFLVAGRSTVEIADAQYASGAALMEWDRPLLEQ